MMEISEFKFIDFKGAPGSVDEDRKVQIETAYQLKRIADAIIVK